MKRIGILTAGGDTPALNATLHGAVTRANALRIDMIGLIRGFGGLMHEQVPHVHLNPLFQSIPELDPTRGGSIIGSSRTYVDASNQAQLQALGDRLKRLQLDGLICVGGDGTLNGLQPLTQFVPTVLVPKTIDNDLGLNYLSEANEWVRESTAEDGFRCRRPTPGTAFDLERMINYVTPGYATAVFVAANGIHRVRTTAESHRRIAIVEVMGRHSGYIALGTSYGQPDIVLVPEAPIDVDRLAARVTDIYDMQQNVVIVCGEGVIDETGKDLGSEKMSTDPSGNVILSGAAEALKRLLLERIGNDYFESARRGSRPGSAIFTRKVGHTQRGGRPVLFDRYYAAGLGGQAVDMLADGESSAVSVLQWNSNRGFHLDSIAGSVFIDRWGHVQARKMHPDFYDSAAMKPSQTGIDYLLPIFTNALGADDVEYIRQTLFDSGNLQRPYHSVNTDIRKRTQFVGE